MSDLLNTQNYTHFHLKIDAFLDSVALNPLEILPRQNSVGKLAIFASFKFKNYFPLTNKELLPAL